MMYIIDSADTKKIKRCVDFYPVAGVTTNPTIISKENADFLNLIKTIRDIIGSEKMFHIQTTSDNAENIIKEAIALKEIVGDNFYIKIPISAEGLKAIMLLKKMNINITATAIFTPQQAMLAAEAGADFVAPYVNRLDNIVSDGVHVVEEIVKMFRAQNIPCKVLAASFKTVEQIHKIALVGGDSVTISPELFELLTYHPMTQYAIDDFNVDWESIYGKNSILDLLNQN